MRRVRVTVPASSANLGPAFDALALAVELRNVIEMEVIENGLAIEVEGEGAEELPRDETNLMVRAAWRVFEESGHRPSGLRIRARNRIPISSGLGSSAAAVIGALVAANALGGAGLDAHGILRLACRLEEHADNVAAALQGGLNLVSMDSGDGVLARRVALPPMDVAVCHPSLRLSTSEMRRILPEQIPHRDAVFNMGRALLTVEALRSADYSLLRAAMRDRLHQPYRSSFIRGFEDVARAALEAGAASVAISGSGPTLIAFAPAGHERIARAMVAAWEEKAVPARGLVLPVATEGVILG